MVPKVLYHKHLSGQALLKKKHLKSKCLYPEEFQNFTASKIAREMEAFIWRTRKNINCEAGKVPEYRVSAWMERLLELKIH